MEGNVSKFFKIWKIVFKYLLYASIVGAALKVALFWLHNGVDDLELTNVVLVFGIFVVGAVVLASIISVWAVIKDHEYQKNKSKPLR